MAITRRELTTRVQERIKEAMDHGIGIGGRGLASNVVAVFEEVLKERAGELALELLFRSEEEED
jgi:hypothetical protein